MELKLPTIRELFDSVGTQISGELGHFFVETAAQMAAVTGRSPQIAMRIQLEKGELYLDREVRRILLELGGCLGRYDLQGQARAISMYRGMLDRMIAVSEGEKKQKTKAWVTAAVCSGLALAVMLL